MLEYDNNRLFYSIDGKFITESCKYYFHGDLSDDAAAFVVKGFPQKGPIIQLGT